MSAPEERPREDLAAGESVQQHLENRDWSGGRTPWLSCRQSRLSRVRLSGCSIGEMQVYASDFEQCFLDHCQCPGIRLQSGQWQMRLS